MKADTHNVNDAGGASLPVISLAHEVPNGVSANCELFKSLGMVFLWALFALSPPLLSSHAGVEHPFVDVTSRGRLIAEYVRAVHTAVEWTRIESAVVGTPGLHYLARRGETAWVVKIGTLDPKRESFLVRCEVSEPLENPSPEVKCGDKAREDTGFFMRGAKAIDLAWDDFRGNGRQYEAVILPHGDRGLYVYFLPAQTIPGRYEFGGDIRYLVSADGTSVLDKHSMHKSIIQFAVSDGSRVPAAGFHTHILTDVPEDSDISYVLLRKPSIPEFISTPTGKYVVQTEGTVVKR